MHSRQWDVDKVWNGQKTPVEARVDAKESVKSNSSTGLATSRVIKVTSASLFPPEANTGMLSDDYKLSDHARLTTKLVW